MRSIPLILLFLLTSSTPHAVAQDVTVPAVPTVDVGDLTGQGNIGTGGGGTSGSDGLVEPVQIEIGGDSIDSRNQGFVGATSVQIQELGFVGASSETSGPPLSDGATFGGGINGGGTQATAGGGGIGGGQFQGGGLNGGFGGQNQLGTGTTNGFQVIRQSLRTRLVPSINARPISNEQTVNRFQNRISRQPVPQLQNQAFAGFASQDSATTSVNVQIENRTATLTGYAGSDSERNRWERQLRLEPGVDRIVNQIQLLPGLVSPAQ